MTTGFLNGVPIANLTGLIYGNGTSNPCTTHVYAEGTWTPVISGSTVAGSGTYTQQSGFYIQIGNIIFLSGRVIWTAHTGTGNLLLTGIPFSSRNVANYRSDLLAILSNLLLPAAAVEINAEVGQNTTTVILEATRNNNTNAPVAMDASGTVDITGFYFI